MKIRESIKKTYLYDIFRSFQYKYNLKSEYDSWIQRQQTGPLPHIKKQEILRSLSKEHSLEVLVETGTYYGDMINALKNDFKYIYSIEVAEFLFYKAKRRFKNEKHVNLMLGDSGNEITKILGTIKLPTLFWLDGHFSGDVTGKGELETPILAEIASIYKNFQEKSVIVIDDLRCFGVDKDYPSLESLESFILRHNPKARITKKFDFLVITSMG